MPWRAIWFRLSGRRGRCPTPLSVGGLSRPFVFDFCCLYPGVCCLLCLAGFALFLYGFLPPWLRLKICRGRTLIKKKQLLSITARRLVYVFSSGLQTLLSRVLPLRLPVGGLLCPPPCREQGPRAAHKQTVHASKGVVPKAASYATTAEGNQA